MAMQQILIGYSLAAGGGGGGSEPTPNYSTLFDGDGDYLDSPNNGDFIGTSNFTIEFWVRFASTAATLETISETRSSTGASDGFLLGRFHGGAHDNQLELYTNGNYSGLASGALSDNTWYYIAVIRNAGTTKMYVDGQDTGTSYADSNNYSNDDIRIGANVSTSYFMDGNIADYRLTKSALYTSNFSVPTEQLTGIQYTSLLCCQDDTNPGTTTVGSNFTEVGDVVAAASAATTSGGGNQIYVDDVFSTFLYDGTSGSNPINNGIDLAGEGGMVWFRPRDYDSGMSPIHDTERSAMGQRISTSSTSEQYAYSPFASINNNGFTLTGDGTAYNNSSYNYVSWTFRKAPGFFDVVSYSGSYATSSNNYNIDSAVSFDGTGGYLSNAGSADFNFGTGSFTIEGFFYKNANTGLQTLLASQQYYTAGNDGNWILRITSGSQIAFASYDGTSSEEYSEFSATNGVGGWHHFAFVREGTGSNQTKFYYDGVLAGSMTLSKSLIDGGSNGIAIGDDRLGPNNPFHGHLSNIRIIKGTALYTSNFTVPTAPLTNVTNTKLLCCQSSTDATAATVTPGTITASGEVAAVNVPVNNAVSHSLGSTPGMIMIKALNGNQHWDIFHTSTGATKGFFMDSNAAGTSSIYFNDTEPTSTHFTVGSAWNTPGKNYIAYLFANDDASFGTDGDESIIKCGSYNTTGDGANVTVDVGFEPQFLLIKSNASSRNWYIFDMMRGINTGQNDNPLYPNTSNTEIGLGTGDFVDLTPTGFIAKGGEVNWFNAVETVTYMAIRSPHKPPVYGTDVFNAVRPSSSGTLTAQPGFVTDWSIIKSPDAGGVAYSGQRLTGGNNLTPETVAIEASVGFSWDFMDKVTIAGSGDYSTWIAWNFKCAPGVLDIVTYDGNSSSAAFSHNLGVKPELVIFKSRSHAQDWIVKFQDRNNYLYLEPQKQVIVANYFEAEDTATTFYGATANAMSSMTGFTYIAYLFASKPGVSKIGTYTGTSTNGAILVSLGFLPRFLMVKSLNQDNRDWIIFDNKRNFTVGSTSAIGRALNNNNTEAVQGETDSVRATTTGFVVVGASATTNVNELNEEYLYLALA